MEEYKQCVEKYEISNFGNCRKRQNDGTYKNIVGSITNAGYRYFQLQRDGKRTNHLFHHLVAFSFIGERMNNLVIDHIDRDKLNNHVHNLRFITFAENLKNCDRYRNDIIGDTKHRTHLLASERYFKNKDPSIRTISKRGNGSITKRENGTWRGTIEINKTKYSKTFKTKEESEEFVQFIKSRENVG